METDWKFHSLFNLKKFYYCISHIVQMNLFHPRINTDPYSIIHHNIGIDQRNRDTVITIFFKALKTGVTGEISGEKVTGLDFIFLQIRGKSVAVKTGIFCTF